MANSDSPIGLRPIRKAGAAYVTGGGNLYHVAVGDAQVIAPGDPVVVTGTADTDGIPTVTRATAGATELITGVMISIADGNAQLDGTGGITFDSSLNTITLTDQYILVEDDPSTVYEAQMSAALLAINISSNANLLAAAPVEGKSQWEVNSASFGVGITLQVKVLRVVRRADNELGANANVEVLINLSTVDNHTVGV